MKLAVTPRKKKIVDLLLRPFDTFCNEGRESVVLTGSFGWACVQDVNIGRETTTNSFLPLPTTALLQLLVKVYGT